MTRHNAASMIALLEAARPGFCLRNTAQAF
jgi:hypothetical protein